MVKRISAVLGVYFSISLLFYIPLYAEESLTVTTYYPSPYGSYNELGTNKLAVGDTNGDSTLNAADQPNRDGDIRLKAQAGDPTSWSAGANGQIAYSSTQGSLYLYNSSSWVPSSGGGACMVTYNSAVGSCSCPSGWTLKQDLGSWGYCQWTQPMGCGSCPGTAFSYPTGGSCPASTGCSVWSAVPVGEGCICCQ